MTQRCAPLITTLLLLNVLGCSNSGSSESAGRAIRGEDPKLDMTPKGGSDAISQGTGAFPAGSSGGTTTTAGVDAGVVSINAAEPVKIEECGSNNPAGLSDDQVMLLRNASSAGSARMLYPYDATVFPRGMISPLLMWEGADATAVRIHITSKEFDYESCLTPTGAMQLQLDQNVWDQAGIKTYGRAEPFHAEISFLVNGEAIGPLTFSFVIAQATVKGSIYYNSYSSKLSPTAGAVLRIPPGGTVEGFTTQECNGCHSVSADGSRLIAQTLATGGRAFELSPGVPNNPPAIAPGPGQRAAFGALYPDGSRFLETSVSVEIARTSLTTPVAGFTDARMFETDTGAEIATTGISAGALMPMFSPDGQYLAYNDYAANNGQDITVVRFDAATNSASDQRVLFVDPDDTRPAWPFFLPDNGALVVARTTGIDFSGDSAGIVPGITGPYSELFLIDMETGKATIMAQAMGFASESDHASSTPYLPFGMAEAANNYFPTVCPVAAGGYFWVFFDSLRNYGNLGVQRQLWAAAVDIAPDGDYTIDRSHPAFYLPGQEFGTGNHRAFAALDPCRKDGDDCTSGIDCCGGSCITPDQPTSEFAGDPVGSCQPPPPDSCVERDGACLTDGDCCPPEEGGPILSCIAGFCAELPVLK